MPDGQTPPAGWYPEGDRLRWWDGAAWTDQFAPLTQPKSKGTDPANNGLVTLGSITAILFPIVGAACAVALMARGDRRGGAILVVSAVVFAAGVALLAAASASASTTISVEDGSPDLPYQRWVDKAKVPTPDVTIWLREHYNDPDECRHACAGFDSEHGRRAEITLNLSSAVPGDLTPQRNFRGRLLHEIGHHFDYRHMDQPSRAGFIGLLGLTGPWRQYAANGSPHALEAGSPHEWFAEAFSQCSWPRAVARGLGGGEMPVPQAIDEGLTDRRAWRRLRRVCSRIIEPAHADGLPPQDAPEGETPY